MPALSNTPTRLDHRLRIFVVDDHPILRVGLKTLISTQFTMEVVGVADDGQTACLEIERLQPNVVIMDLSMPVMNGARTTERLKQICPKVKVLVLTVHEEKSYILDALSAGACGYVLKRTPADELIRAIYAVDSGGIYLDPAIAHKVVDNSNHAASNHEFAQGVNLTEREAQALCLIALGYSVKEIAAQMGISGKTVETYRARFMDKLQMDSRTDIVRYALHQGWLQDS